MAPIILLHARDHLFETANLHMLIPSTLLSMRLAGSDAYPVCFISLASPDQVKAPSSVHTMSGGKEAWSPDCRADLDLGGRHGAQVVQLLAEVVEPAGLALNLLLSCLAALLVRGIQLHDASLSSTYTASSCGPLLPGPGPEAEVK